MAPPSPPLVPSAKAGSAPLSPPKTPKCEARKAACSLPLSCHPELVKDQVPTPKSMAELVDLLKAEMGSNGLDSKDVDISRVCALMEKYTSNCDDWKRFALFDPSRYTRNLVDEGNGKFNLMILCWGPGHQSAIHDHAQAHCCMKILQGTLTETQYLYPDLQDAASADQEFVACGRMAIKGERQLRANQVAYINDAIGLHRVGNKAVASACPSQEHTPAVSLHLYTPPFKTCKTFCERSGVARPVSQCVFYSKFGERCPFQFSTLAGSSEMLANASGKCPLSPGSASPASQLQSSHSLPSPEQECTQSRCYNAASTQSQDELQQQQQAPSPSPEPEPVLLGRPAMASCDGAAGWTRHHPV